MLTFAVWEEGFVVAPGNPKGLRGPGDFGRRDLVFVNRELGSGSRRLADSSLAAHKIGLKTTFVRRGI